MKLTKIKQAIPSTFEEALEDYKNHVNLFLKRFPSSKESYENLERDSYIHLGQDVNLMRFIVLSCLYSAS